MNFFNDFIDSKLLINIMRYKCRRDLALVSLLYKTIYLKFEN